MTSPTEGGQKAPEKSFDLEKFRDDFFELIDRYTDAIGEDFFQRQGESTDTKTPRDAVIQFFAEADIPAEWLDPVFQSVTEILFGSTGHGEKNFQDHSLKLRTDLLKAMTLARLKNQAPEIRPEDYRQRIIQMIDDRG